MLMLDVKSCIIRSKLLAEGTIDEVPFYLQKIVKEAVRANAKKVILAHSHPRGSFKPSKNDIDLTIKASEQLRGVGIILLDHIIVGKDGYSSVIANYTLDGQKVNSKDVINQYEIDY
jgi:DNA repair protein RadC